LYENNLASEYLAFSIDIFRLLRLQNYLWVCQHTTLRLVSMEFDNDDDDESDDDDDE
jgi:hypothetical protein